MIENLTRSIFIKNAENKYLEVYGIIQKKIETILKD